MSQGRLTKLTPENIRKILDALRTGAPRKFACRSAGVSDRTFTLWMRHGRAKRSKEHVAFFSAVQKAEADGVCQNLKKIQTAGRKNWQALAWMLERRFQEDFGVDRRELKELRGQVKELMEAIRRLTGGESAPDPSSARTDPAPGGGDRSATSEGDSPAVRPEVDGGEPGPLPEGPAEPTP